MDGKSECKLLSNKPFIFLVLAGAFIMFSVASIQYWATNYFIKALGADQKYAFIEFGVISITAPIFGCAASAVVSDKLGGFTSLKILPVGLVVSASVMVTSLFITIEIHVVQALIEFWLVLFLGALTLPIVIGVMLTKVEPEMRPTANSFANFMYNVLGFFPAPILYGLANELDDEPNKSHNGQAVVSIACFLTTLFILFAMLTDKDINYLKMYKDRNEEKENSGLSKQDILNEFSDEVAVAQIDCASP